MSIAAPPGLLIASPWPPARSEIANNVAQVQVPALLAQTPLCLLGTPPVERGADPAAPLPPIPDVAGLPVHAIAAGLQANPHAILLAHVGNEANQNTAALHSLSRRAGYVVLHDLVMHNAWFDQCVRSGRFADYAHSVGEFYGPRIQQQAMRARHYAQTVRHLAPSVPLFEPFLRNALGVVVHSAMAFDAVAVSKRWPVCRLDLHYNSPNSAQTAALLAHRAAQGQALASGEPLRLVVFGHLSANRCLPQIIDAVLALQTATPRPVRLDVYGKTVEAERLQLLIEVQGLAHCIQLHGFVPEEILAQGLHQAHLAINLRLPTMGEASGSQLRLYAAGLPSVLMQTGWYGEQPADAVFHLPAAVQPSAITESLVHTILQVLQNPHSLLPKAQAGLAHLQGQHNPDRYARQLLAFMEHARPNGQRLLGARSYMNSLAEATVDLGLAVTVNISEAVQSLLAPAGAPAPDSSSNDLPIQCLLPQADSHTVAQFMRQHITMQQNRPAQGTTGRRLALDEAAVLPQQGTEPPLSFVTPTAAAMARTVQAVRLVQAADPNLAELARRAQPRSTLPSRIQRSPLGKGPLGRGLLKVWNFLSREWREPFDVTHRIVARHAGLLAHHTERIDQLENYVNPQLTELGTEVAQLSARAEAEFEELRQFAQQQVNENMLLRQQINHSLTAVNTRLHAAALPDAAGNAAEKTAWPANGASFIVAPPAQPVWQSSASDAAPQSAQVNAFMQHVASHFRGNEAAQRERLAANLPAVAQALQQVKDRAASASHSTSLAGQGSKAPTAFGVLDLGCGQGDWLALLQAAGHNAQGVDMAAECVQACTRQGLKARQGDALAALKSTPPGSLAAVTAFHLIEHIPLAAQISLFADAYRALAPGGLLLVETPNPENLAVIGRNFWYDPTHQRPLPAELLRLLALHAGFAPEHIQAEPRHPPEVPPLEADHYPPRTRHMLFCGQDTLLRAWK